jgi:hypothetical protein
MASRAFERFRRGLREPWDLLGHMREDPALWHRYWRTVLLQAALALVAGLVVFWVGKQGADAWNDAFGPEDVPAARASPVAGGQKSTDAARAPEEPPSSSPPGATGAGTPPPAPRPPTRTQPGKATPSPPESPPPPPARAPHEATNAFPPGAPVAAKPTTGEEAEDEADGDDSGDVEELADSNLEEKIKALQAAPPEERSKRTADLVAAALQKAKTETTRARKHAERQSSSGGDAADELKEEREEVTEKLGDLTLAAEALAREPPSKVGAARSARRRLERELDGVEKDQGKLEKRGAPPLNEAEQAKLARARAALQVVRRHERGLVGRFGAVLALLAAIYASLGLAQTGILALSRDFHDALSRDLSLLVHVAPEDPPMRPKIRLDLPWVRRKAGRRAQFFLGFLPGTALITVVGWFIPPHRTLVTVLTAIWAAYWWMVMTAGQSARAWTPPETTPRPWYLRAWFWLSDRVFFFRWWGRIWERFARRFYGPSERVAEQPFEFAGLSLSRALLLVPVLKLLFRPIFSVAAAHLLVEHAATARLPVPVSATELAAAAAEAPDPDARTHSGVAS